MKRFLSAALIIAPAFAAMAVSVDQTAGTAADLPTAAIAKYAEALSGASAKNFHALLPASYRKDVSSVMSAFGNKMDPEIWSAAQSIVADLARLAAMKSDLIAEALAEDSTKSKAEIAAMISQVAPEVKKFAEKITLDVLKAGKVEALLAMPEFAAISKFTSDNLPPEAKVSVESVVRDNAGAIIAKLRTPDGDAEDTEFVNVEGAWIPKEMAEDWKDGVKDALEAVNEMKFDDASKQQFLSMLPMIKGAIGQAGQATTVEQLNQAVMMPVMLVAMMVQQQGGGADPGPAVEAEDAAGKPAGEEPATRQVPGAESRSAPPPVTR